MKYKHLLDAHPIISDQVSRRELEIILFQLEEQLHKGVQGAVVEFGCYVGTTSLFIRRLLDVYNAKNEFHVYDSFAGLPEKTTLDLSPIGEQFRAGELAASKKQFMGNFIKAGLKPPIVHKGWFSEMSTEDVPHRVSLAFLDGDYYDSVMSPLRLIWSRLTPDGVVIVDDYANESLPGARKAVDEWLNTHPARLRVEASLASITK